MMRTRFSAIALAALVAAALLPAAAEAAQTRSSGPTLHLDEGTVPAHITATKMMGVDGERVSIRESAGRKGTLVVFTCNACPWVKAWQERITALGNEFSRRGIGVIAINSNDPNRVAEDGYEQMQERAEELGVRFPYVVDATSEVARAFGAMRTPEAFLFDGEGRLVYHGTIDDNAKDASAVDQTYLRDALLAVVRGEEVPMARTKALGCGIKFRPEG